MADGKASLCERLVNATLGMGAGSGACAIQIWTYGLLPEISKALGAGEYFETGIEMLGATAIVTAGALGIIGSYKLLKHAVNGEKIGW